MTQKQLVFIFLIGGVLALSQFYLYKTFDIKG